MLDYWEEKKRVVPPAGGQVPTPSFEDVEKQCAKAAADFEHSMQKAVAEKKEEKKKKEKKEKNKEKNKKGRNKRRKEGNGHAAQKAKKRRELMQAYQKGILFTTIIIILCKSQFPLL